jgi:hypothetical protein
MSTNTIPIRLRHFVAVKGEDSQATREGASAITVETIAYWAVMAAIYIGFGFLWYYAAKEKLIDDSGTMPEGLAKGYAGSFVSSFPGLNATWLILGILEAVTFLGFIASIVTGEFLPGRPKTILLGALSMSLLTMSVLIFGQALIGENEGVASLFGYFAAIIVTILLVQMLPPRRGIWRLASPDEDGKQK